MGGIGTGELVIILLIVLVFFGGAKLPGLARSLGQAQREFRQGTAEGLPDEQSEGEKPSA
jgi:sec-independent protein translocase protein TatA